ncbi:c-type cytochrome [Helicobacter saguini]|uniref:C-type cytochrome n=1 Tax=Helicobacter saguini TaxID=1548018 RepID=A0A347VPR4_9HELI|nr:c-type cytochrome [Helicobacter saguini]MWV68085.1 c-type cytochrome [Helicobacter saguini]MWV70451.1 c-type cytochrome [Helicobacter saguini]MWV72352.1 c-type cytochrome [Helicobacter saguini]TLD93001.1 cytochrome-c peroxidase [Helicobacter saguini]
MLKKSYVLIGASVALVASVAIAASTKMPSKDALLTKAKDAGLEPLPQGKALESYQLAYAKKHNIAQGYAKIMTKEQIELGKKLYFDPRLSESNLISCNTCHNLALAGADLVPAAIGHKWQANPEHLNSPTSLNSMFNEIQFWNGRAADLSTQAQGPIANPVEMALNDKDAVAKITSIPAYVSEFKRAFGANVKIDYKLIADSIAMFEMTLNTPSRYDAFLNGNANALSKDEKAGLETFIEKGCTSCHNGVNLGGNMQAFGLIEPYKYEKLGGFKGDSDGMVKTPTLRNVLQTSPYFHNGAFWDVRDAIKEMGRIQLGVAISDKEAESIATFFKALDGELPKVSYPTLPASTNKTKTPSF